VPVFNQAFVDLLFSDFKTEGRVWLINASNFLNSAMLKERAEENLIPGRFPGIYLFNIPLKTFEDSNLNHYLANHQIETLGIDALPYMAIEKLVDDIPLSVKKIGLQNLHKKSVELIYKKVKAILTSGRVVNVICGKEIPEDMKIKIGRLYLRPVVLKKQSSTQSVTSNLGAIANSASIEAKVIAISKKRQRSSTEEVESEPKPALDYKNLNDQYTNLQSRYEREKRARLEAEAKVEEQSKTILMLQHRLNDANIPLPQAFAISISPPPTAYSEVRHFQLPPSFYKGDNHLFPLLPREDDFKGMQSLHEDKLSVMQDHSSSESSYGALTGLEEQDDETVSKFLATL
jgi:hypothetical protein